MMSEKRFINHSRRKDTEYLSAKVFGEERITKINAYCQENNMTYRTFFEKIIDNFFSNKKNELMMLTKEQLVKMITEGDASK